MKLKTVARFAMVAVIAGFVLGPAVVTNAAEDPANVIKFRQMLMKSIGAHMGSIAAVAKGEVDQGMDHIVKHAEAIALVAVLIPDAFEKNVGSTAAETNAKDTIWSDWTDFRAKAQALPSAAAKLAQAAGSGDKQAMFAALKETGGACGACHKANRIKN